MENWTDAGSSGARAKAASKPWELNLLGSAWHLFSSVRLALSLILLLTAAVLAGTLLMQVPPSVFADQASYAQWLERARGKYGPFLTDVFDMFQLLNVFHSIWFQLLLGLLTVNILVSSVRRWKGVWTAAFGTRTRMGDAFFQHTRFKACLTPAMPVSTTAVRVKRALYLYFEVSYRLRALALLVLPAGGWPACAPAPLHHVKEE